MKKTYIIPQLDVVNIQACNMLLAGSTGDITNIETDSEFIGGDDAGARSLDLWDNGEDIVLDDEEFVW